MRPIMILGTGSNVGKTTLVAGLCRMLSDRGLRVAPFKSQNMSLNSFVTDEGGEIARSTALQAAAARQRPSVHMNPLLLKPKSDTVSQLIVHGRATADVSAKDYFLSPRFDDVKIAAISDSIRELRGNFDIIVAEGAGSCAEPNLRDRDLVNTGLAHVLGADAYLVADIDQGGVFAEFCGTLAILDLVAPSDRSLFRGFVINKFRGDRRVLEPALEFVQRHTGISVTTVLPFLSQLNLEEEDRVRPSTCIDHEITVCVVYLPRISNATDFDVLTLEHGVEVRFVRPGEGLGKPDAVILPGTRNTIEDLAVLRETGTVDEIRKLAVSTPIVGICGGFELLGNWLHDPFGIESRPGSFPGLGLLDCEFEFASPKELLRGIYQTTDFNPYFTESTVRGFEIHCGKMVSSHCAPAFVSLRGPDGAVSADRRILGTWIHDLFNDGAFVRSFVNQLRRQKGLAVLPGLPLDRDALRDDALNRLASVVAENWSLSVE